MKLEKTKGSSIYDAIPAKGSPSLQRNSPRLCFRPGHFDAGAGGRHRGFCGGKPAGCAQSAGQLAFRSAVDPFTFVAVAADAGSARHRMTSLATARVRPGTASDLARHMQTALTARYGTMQSFLRCCTRIRGTSVRGGEALPGVCCMQSPRWCGHATTMAHRARTMPTSPEVLWPEASRISTILHRTGA
jgi:hypothetical protein